MDFISDQGGVTNVSALQQVGLVKRTAILDGMARAGILIHVHRDLIKSPRRGKQVPKKYKKELTRRLAHTRQTSFWILAK